MRTARAFWLTEPGQGEIRTVELDEPGADDVLVRTVHSGVSRGTEALVFRGEVPESQRDAMRAPFQEGDFPAPVKYGYLAVGVVEHGPANLVGRTVFCLHPHQTRFVVPATAVTVVPDSVPPARAVLAGAVETAVNAAWDAAPLVGDRIAVVGAGMVGCCVARLLAGIPGTRLQLVDTVPSRAWVAEALDVEFTEPAGALPECDLVVHASGTDEGLRRSLELVRTDGTVIEMSWFGDRRPALPLGEAFHSRRVTIRSSQVGTVSPARSTHRSIADRMRLALRLLTDPAFDAIVTGHSAFEDLPQVMPALAAGEMPALCHRIDYDGVSLFSGYSN
ncbi:dehydrogenase [Allosaccharopolyspora coralli]|uniref:Dehydrogenase n=1 Tax=Allosaccharopolyspora coralli TaxID=2665642 RepID=A0A5Q3Q3R0_9PSEU|nr:zinc-binding alcohol dehydrogenase [Allosaccharopolyspora coralli]QGK69072.1 dehydrogenase [Allosaccharopolyspora coralli]